MAWSYRDLLNAGRNNTIRELTREDILYGLPEGYDMVDRYAAYSPDRVEDRGDYGVADNAFLNDADWNKVQEHKNQWQYYKSIGDQAGMDAAHNAAQQIRYKYGYSGGADGSEYNSIMANVGGIEPPGVNYGEANGGYNSGYQSSIDAALDALLKREGFFYDKNTDPLYQQYKESYTRGADRAMKDTLAQISARTGGLASSYAGSASQQAYNEFMAGLADKVPELYQMRYNMYLNDIEQRRKDLDTLLGIDDMFYGRYRDTVGDNQWQQQFDYNASRDKVSDSQWQQQFDYNAAMDDREWDYKLLQDAMSKNIPAGESENDIKDETYVSSDAIEGMNADHFRAYMQSIAQQLASSKLEAAESNINGIWDGLNEEQRLQLSELLGKYGLTTE